jgi:hypothetical protein
MRKLFSLLGATLGGSLGWWLGGKVGFMTAFALSTVGSGAGIYFGIRLTQALLE